MLDMVQLMEDMGKATMNLNTNATRAMKLNATLLLVRYHLIIARIEKKKSARSRPKWCQFQLKGRIVMTKTRKYANLKKDLSQSKLRNTSILRNVVQSPKLFVTMLIKSSSS